MGGMGACLLWPVGSDHLRSLVAPPENPFIDSPRVHLLRRSLCPEYFLQTLSCDTFAARTKYALSDMGARNDDASWDGVRSLFPMGNMRAGFTEI